MLIAIVKTLHVLIAMGLLITVFMAIKAVNKPHNSTGPKVDLLIKLNVLLLLLAIAALITGTLLVHPEHFTYHTHWIVAAYVLLVLFGLNILLLIYWRKKHNQRSKPMTTIQRIIWQAIYIVLGIILLLILHDAVSRATLLF